MQSSDDVERALARKLGSEMRRLRERKYLTQGALARQAGHYSRSTIATVETGWGKCSLKLIQRCDEVLEAGGALVAIYLKLKEQQVRRTEVARNRSSDRNRETAQSWDAPALSEPVLPFADHPDVYDERRSGAVTMFGLPAVVDGRLTLLSVPLARRNVLPAEGDTSRELRMLVGSDRSERLHAVTAGRGRADLEVVRHLAALLAHERVLDDLIGPQRMLAPVRAFTLVLDQLRQDAEPDIQRALLSVAAQYDQFTGWLWVDSGNDAMAGQFHDRALARATEGGHHALARYLLACKSEQALMGRQTRTAVMLAQEAQSVDGGPKGTWRLTPAVKAWAADLEGRAWALLGEERLCREKLEEAEALLTGSARADEPPWIYHFVPETLDVHRGICYTALGKAEAAITVFGEAIKAVPEQRPRDRAYYLSWLARAHASNDEPDQASAVARQAAELGSETDSTRVLTEVRLLYRELDPSIPAVRELGELLQQTAAR